MKDVFTGGRHATVAACLKCRGQWMRDSDLQRLSAVVEAVPIELLRLAPEEVQQAELICPECDPGGPLRKVQAERDPRVTLDACEVCGGVWLDDRELNAIQQESLLAMLSGLARGRAAPHAHP